jgi:uroporphyrinogen-III synthase
MKRVIVLRPEPGASATVERARERGLDAVAIPLFEIEPVDWEVPDPTSFDALLLTSANAVRCGRRQIDGLRSLPVHAVGQASADAARRKGFTVASTGDAGVNELLDSLSPDLRLLHLCGEHRRPPDNPRQAITPVVVYRSRPKALVDPAQAAGRVALIHSPRAAEHFASLVDEAGIDRSRIAIAAISVAAADAAGKGWASIHSAPGPDDDALLALAERLCNNPDEQ